jgi:hypothetical protein
MAGGVDVRPLDDERSLVVRVGVNGHDHAGGENRDDLEAVFHPKYPNQTQAPLPFNLSESGDYIASIGTVRLLGA